MAATLSITGPGIPSVITSPSGTRKVLSPGSSVLIGCPVAGHPAPNITWFYVGQPFSMPHRVLAAGQILQIVNITDDYQGEISCMAQNEAGLFIQKTSLTIQDYWWSMDKMSPCSASCGNKGFQHHQLRCLLDGVQTRRVTCHKLTAAGNSVPLSNDMCAQTAKRPVDTQSCNRQLCVEWATSAWSQCNGPCIGSQLAIQHRQVFCQTRNGISVPSDQCSSLPRPLSTQNCWTDTCGVHWRVSLWTLCTATCGNYGFQSRRVECVRVRTNKPVQEHFCSWRPRPANWQRCNITPCENVECRDTTRYCEKVKLLKLCQLTQFKSRCCGTCGKA
ncbi:hypothetical protein lerEdw1_000062 [Lerista edwardsae]|nr:hypothetical protein lerEdw1_000062 [Lerista edwardsae]